MTRRPTDLTHPPHPVDLCRLFAAEACCVANTMFPNVTECERRSLTNNSREGAAEEIVTDFNRAPWILKNWGEIGPVAGSLHRCKCQTAHPGHTSTPRGARRPGFARKLNRPQKTEGVGNAGCPVAPAASRAENGHHAHEYSQRGTGKHPAFPHAMVLRIIRALPGDSLLPPSPSD